MNKNTSSIARKLNWSWTTDKLGTYFFIDILVLAVAIAGWCYYAEMSYFGDVHIKVESREFDIDREKLAEIEGNHELIWYDEVVAKFECIYYVVDSGSIVMEKNVAPLFDTLFVFGQVVVAIEILDVLISLFFGVFGIRRKLKPLDDMAKRAEELSRIAFDESKYANLEDAICHVNPDGSDGVVSTGNKDLEGVEMAINNLLTKMRDSYRQQSRFVSDASHELRTPIAVIQGYANMLDRWGKEDEKVLEEAIEAIKNESEHMKTLVEQLLFLARGDAGRNKMEMADISLKDIMKEVFEESCMIDENHVYELAVAGNVYVQGANGESGSEAGVLDVRMIGDFAMIKQSVRILVDNAAKYTAQGETITLRCGVNGEGQPFFSIQDNGIGMNAREVSHVFERFYRSDEARNRQTGGTGLGLSIAKWIIDKHNGYIDVLSRPEIGTRFTVAFKK